MHKSIIVIYHVKDQAVCIKDVCIFAYTENGLKEANERLEELEKRVDHIYAETTILPSDEASEVFKTLSEGDEHVVYDYMFGKESDDLRDIKL